ncbi:MAG: hypothetical protein GX146_04325 [Myxococcales bacterium]|nr:hypothetical protein [Myxococcales bacterium]
MTPHTPSRRSWLVAIGVLVGARLLVGLWLLAEMAPLSADDYFRVFYAAWWWDHPRFASYYIWLPGHSWLYGPWVGLSQDMIAAPRALTLLWQLGTGLLPLALTAMPRAQRLWAVTWLLFVPLALPLGCAPLTEAATGFFIMAALVSARRAREQHSAPWTLLAAISLFAAATLRYEAWLLAPIWALWLLRRIDPPVTRFTRWLLALFPLSFPAIWTLYGRLGQGEWLAFLRSTHEDHFGAPNWWSSLATAEGGINLLLLSLAIALIVFRHRRHTARTAELSGFFFAAFALFYIALAATDALPSQYPLRLLYPLFICLALPLASSLDALTTAHRRALFALFAALSLSGVALSLARPAGVAPWNTAAAAWIQAQYQSGALPAEAHVLIGKHMPDNTAVFVFANQMSRVHLDAMGRACQVQFLSHAPPTCPLPPWGDQVYVVLAWRGSAEARYISGLGWDMVFATGPWQAWRKPEGHALPLRRPRMSEPTGGAPRR